ncbi:hypothetical protein Raf01_28720 [Rugosimonospora africana]|uniref:Uncharacterized protein n=1 Tax=Rugosimonospora africana TaxID=556532 RepID=A0A8J3QNY6_9ACTN|nr:hypothetical protein Raf01_28720 [Rugosimonospora africana]
MNLQLARVLPTRLRHQSRVLEIQCPVCGQWRKPRHIRIPAMVCRNCETTDNFQTWMASPRRQLVTGGTR